MLVSFKQRHDFVVEKLNAIPGVNCLAGNGTFYAFADFSEAIKAYGSDSDVNFAEAILEKTGVALVPGSAFGTAGCMRISFATSNANLESAMERLAKELS
jgi:aspartate aminotransferase